MDQDEQVLKSTHASCTLVLRTAERRQCDICRGSASHCNATSQPLWVSCVECSYDECIGCASSAERLEPANHPHPLEILRPAAILDASCSLCLNSLKIAYDTRHRYCPTCNATCNRTDRYFECTNCHHQQIDAEHRPKFRLTGVNYGSAEVVDIVPITSLSSTTNIPAAPPKPTATQTYAAAPPPQQVGPGNRVQVRSMSMQTK